MYFSGHDAVRVECCDTDNLLSHIKFQIVNDDLCNFLSRSTKRRRATPRKVSSYVGLLIYIQGLHTV